MTAYSHEQDTSEERDTEVTPASSLQTERTNNPSASTRQVIITVCQPDLQRLRIRRDAIWTFDAETTQRVRGPRRFQFLATVHRLLQ